MTAHTPVEQPEKPINWGLFVGRFAVLIALFVIAVFASAGTFNWPMAWLYVVITVGIIFIGRYWMFLRNPDLLEERASALDREDTKSWDKVIVPLIAIIGPFAQIIVAGLDFRFDWSPAFPLWLELLGLAIMTFGHIFGTWPTLVNKFYSSGVRIQKDRDHYVVKDGPYAIVRHPSYTGNMIGNLGTSLLLSSLWSLIPFALVVITLVIRTKLEDDTLQAELEGYKAYTQETRYRLIPGIW